MRIARLTDDYLSHTTEDKMLFSKHREAPAVFEYKENYYLITSGCTGWAPNKASLHQSASLFGPWTNVGNPMIGPNADSTFGGRSSFCKQCKGKKILSYLWQINETRRI